MSRKLTKAEIDKLPKVSIKMTVYVALDALQELLDEREEGSSDGSPVAGKASHGSDSKPTR